VLKSVKKVLKSVKKFNNGIILYKKVLKSVKKFNNGIILYKKQTKTGAINTFSILCLKML